MPSLEERFWAKVQPESPGCWIWTACLQHGYGYFSINNRFRRAHRVAYEILVGPIPDGLVIDHLCRNKACVNPDHLEPVTIRENTLRGASVLDHCVNGHRFTKENTYVHPNGRHRACRACRRKASNAE